MLVFLLGVLVFLYLYTYQLVTAFFRLVLFAYFRKIEVSGINHIPRNGPVIVCPNHPNMIIDPLLILTRLVQLGRSPYCWAKAALFRHPIQGWFFRALGGVPVTRPPKTEAAVVDSSVSPTPPLLSAAQEQLVEQELKLKTELMFEASWDVLKRPQSALVLFPEGTSYTASQMLGLKTGVMRVACGFVKRTLTPISIVPSGLTYFSKDRFRSAVSIEFGLPLVIDVAMLERVNYAENERRAIQELTEILKQRMLNVTLNAPDYDTIVLARTLRRLYCSGKTMTEEASVELALTRDIIGLLVSDSETKDSETKDSETTSESNSSLEEWQQLVTRVTRYQAQLVSLRITDHYLLYSLEEPLVQMALEQMLYLVVLLPLGLPGFLLSMPFYVIGHKLNHMTIYAEEKSTFKVMANALLVPVQWIVLVVLVGWIFGVVAAQIMTILLPVLLYSHIRVLEESFTALECLSSLWNIGLRKELMSDMKKERCVLVSAVQVCIGRLSKFSKDMN